MRKKANSTTIWRDSSSSSPAFSSLLRTRCSQTDPSFRYAWPVCFLLSGLFLLVFSDTELWPFGSQSWWYGLTHNPEDLQHKTFAVILLALGIIEVQRARGILKSAWAGWVSPVLACCGSVMLLFHQHHSGMHGEHPSGPGRFK